MNIDYEKALEKYEADKNKAYEEYKRQKEEEWNNFKQEDLDAAQEKYFRLVGRVFWPLIENKTCWLRVPYFAYNRAHFHVYSLLILNSGFLRLDMKKNFGKETTSFRLRKA